MEKLGSRKGRMVSMEHRTNRIRFLFSVPSRGLFGYRSEFLTDTRGEGVMYSTVRGYEPWVGELEKRAVGGIVATDQGQTTPFAISKIQERSALFVDPGVPVYEGQIVGENRRPGDMNVNVVRAKKLDNMRAAGKEDAPIITPARKMTIESALQTGLTTALAADGTLSALTVPVYPHFGPQSAALPFCTYAVEATDIENNLNYSSKTDLTLSAATVRLHVWAGTVASRALIMTAIKVWLHGFRGALGTEQLDIRQARLSNVTTLSEKDITGTDEEIYRADLSFEIVYNWS